MIKFVSKTPHLNNRNNVTSSEVGEEMAEIETTIKTDEAEARESIFKDDVVVDERQRPKKGASKKWFILAALCCTLIIPAIIFGIIFGLGFNSAINSVKSENASISETQNDFNSKIPPGFNATVSITAVPPTTT